MSKGISSLGLCRDCPFVASVVRRMSLTPHVLPSEIPLRCSCGRLRGTASAVAPGAGCRVICYCDDCQAYLRFLGRSEFLDQWGGTDIFQMAPNRLHLEDPSGALACVRLSPKGMYVHAFMDHDSDGRARNDVLGKPYYSQGKFAAEGLPAERMAVPLGAIVKSVRLLGKWWLTGAGTPSPFFVGSGGEPRVSPRVLTADERRAI